MRLTTKVVIGLVLVLGLVEGIFGGLYGPKSDVISLTKDNFAKSVLADDHVWLVEFYAPWCGHCKNLAPEWEKAATNLKGLIRVGAVDCDEEKNRELCGSFGVQGFPTVKLFPSEQIKSAKGITKQPIDYQQQRTAAAIVNFALNNLPSHSVTLNPSNIKKFEDRNDIAKVILFTNKADTPALFKALSIDFKGRLAFGEVKHTQKDLVSQYGVSEFPTLLVIKTDGEKVKFEGKLGHEALFTFLSQFAPAKPESSNGNSKPVEDRPAEVHEVKTQEDFEKQCLSKPGSCVIAFLDIEDEEGKRKERDLAMLKNVAEKFKKSFYFVWLDGIKNLELADALGTTILPSISVYNHGKKAYVPLVGAFEEKAIGEFLNKVLVNKKPAVPIPLTRNLPKVV